MPKTSDSIFLDLEDLLATRGFEVSALDSSGKSLPTANGADILTFHFHRGGKDYGTVTISIDGLKDMTVYYDDKIANSGVSEENRDADRGMNGTSWISLVKQLKKFALRHQLGFKLQDSDRLRTDMRRRTHNNKLSESYDGIGFSVRTDILWPATIFESTNPVIVQKFTEWLNDYRDEIIVPKQEQKCVLAMMIVGANEINIVHGPAKFIDETSTHYVLDNGNGEHEYSKKNQIVFKNDTALEECIMVMTLKFADSDLKIKTQSSPVTEAFSHRKNLKNLKKDSMNESDKFSRSNSNAAMKSNTKLDEGYYGNRKMSYSDDTPQVKMIIKHNRQLEETDKRFRHIEKIFLETDSGERFAVPTNKPSRARMFARHIAEGGAYKDSRWSHLTEICEDIDALGGFIRATRSTEQFNESAQRMISEVGEKYSELRTRAKRLQTSGGYNNYFESYEPAVKNDDDSDLLEVFKHSSVDSRIERAMPTLSKLGIRRGKLEEADQFESWANELIDESLDPDSERQTDAIVELLADELPVGPNAEVVLGELEDVIESDELEERLRKMAEIDPDSDARPQIIAWMQEQDRPAYRKVLDKISQDDSDSAEDKSELKKSDSSRSIEPAVVKPKKNKQPSTNAGAAGGLPPLPGAGGLPPLPPPLPPLKEGDDAMMSFKRLLER